ncbi:unnamed protein product [Ectocarpus sp. 6 AP-2014]
MARPSLLMVLLAVSCHRTSGFALRGPVHARRCLTSAPFARRTLCATPRPQAAPTSTRCLIAKRRLSSVPVELSAAEATDVPQAPTPATASSSSGPSLLATGTSFTAIVVADFVLRRAFVRAGIAFPPSLAGMVVLFAGLVVLERAAPKSAEGIVSSLEPGAALLARWLPVFFAPSLVVLPLSPPPSPVNALKLLLLVCGGWFVSLSSTAAVVGALSPPADVSTTNSAAPSKTLAPVFRGPFVRGLGAGAVVSGVLAVAGGSGQAPGALLAKLSKPAAQLSLLLATLFGFSAGTRMPRRVSKAVHPVVMCSAVAMGTAAAIGKGVGLGFADMLRSYLTRSRCPVHLGAGDVLLGLLGPSVLSFAVQMYRRRNLIFEDAKQVAAGSVFCASSGLFGTALVSRLLGLPTTLRLAALSRNITSPLAMAICSLIGADPSLAIAIVVLTGVIGANFGATALDALGVKDPAARGLAQGGSAHGLGTAAMVNEPTAFAFSAVSMALTATASTVLVSIPSVRTALLRLALGAAAGLPAAP